MGRFSRYEFVQKIAVGGMAEVWSAWAVGADGAMTDVVVKRILPQFAADSSFQDMLLSEAEVTAHLQHPNIVGVLDWGHLDETCFLAMERVVGLDGRQLLDACAMRRIAIPPAVALHAIGEVFKGLDYAHRARDERGQPLGLVHRDVSPSNVLLSVTGDVKLADFGIARAKSRASHTVAGQVRGKPRYMSPEQAKGEELDGRSDLFAAGLVLHEFLTGQPVFPASTYLEEVLALINKGVPPPSRVNPAVPPELDALVLRLCERDITKRIKTGAAAYDALADWASQRKMKLGAGDVAELVSSIVRPTQTKKPAEVKGETRIVRLDGEGVPRFTTQGKQVDPDFLGGTTIPSGRAPPIGAKTSPSGRLSSPVRGLSEIDRPTDPPLPVTNMLQMPTSSRAVPEDDGPTDRRASPGAVVGALDAPETMRSGADALDAVDTSPSRSGAVESPDTEKRPPRSRATGSAGITAATAIAATAIAVAIWWVVSPRSPVQTGDLLDESPVPTLVIIEDPLAALTPIVEETPAVVVAVPTPTIRKPRASATPTVAATPTAAPVIAAGKGFLNLRAKPNGEVTIDGQWAGSTPLSKHELSSGVHTITVNADDGRQATQEVTILPNESTTITLTLRTPSP